ncbi:MAG: RusA family crossover junction endodeoxyribonuclease [Alphaproteobacteria bacterium]
MFEAFIPVPPSVNAAYRSASRNGRTVVYKSSEYKRWEQVAMKALLKAGINPDRPMLGSLIVRYNYHFRDAGRRDIGNFEKALSDFLETVGVYKNDCQIDELIQRRGNMCRDNPCVHVLIHEREEFNE